LVTSTIVTSLCTLALFSISLSSLRMKCIQSISIAIVFVFLFARITESQDLHEDCGTPHTSHEDRWLLGEQAEIEFFGQRVRYV
jgi:hypothetical protein